MDFLEDNAGLLIAMASLVAIAIPLALLYLGARRAAASAEASSPDKPAATAPVSSAQESAPTQAAEPPVHPLDDLRKRLSEVRDRTRQAEQRERWAQGRLTAAERRLEGTGVELPPEPKPG